MSKKRPGYDAAIRLSKTTDLLVWERVEAQLPEVISSIPNLKQLTSSREVLAKTSKESDDHSLSKEELMTMVQWKFCVGKPRNALLKLLRSNTDEMVEEISRSAISKSKSIETNVSEGGEEEIKAAILELSSALKGVGPATASAILSMVRPDIFCYMYDEVIDCFLPKRTYTLPVYITINKECTRIAKSMEGWTPFRVAQALWVAARVCAAGGDDHTAQLESKRKVKTTNSNGQSDRPKRRKRA